MSFEIQVALTSNFLGSGKRKNGVRKLRKLPDGLVRIDLKELCAALVAVCTDKEIDIDVKTLGVSPGVDPPRINLLRRVYNRVNVDRFEGMEAGTRLSLFCNPSSAVRIEDLHILFTQVGQKYGISQFGKKFNCGRFKVISIIKV